MMKNVMKKQMYTVGGYMQNKLKGENSMNELTCKKCNETTIMGDEGVVSVTCGLCSMADIHLQDGLEVV